MTSKSRLASIKRSTRWRKKKLLKGALTLSKSWWRQCQVEFTNKLKEQFGNTWCELQQPSHRRRPEAYSKCEVMVSRMALILWVLECKLVLWLYEQPKTSLLWEHPRMQEFLRQCDVWKTHMHMGSYGASSPKPTFLWAPTPCVHAAPQSGRENVLGIRSGELWKWNMEPTIDVHEGDNLECWPWAISTLELREGHAKNYRLR